jgi:DNA-3-methyladenine glycosylase II
MRILASEADIAEGLKHLRKADPRLRAVIKTAGKVPLRRSEGGFTGIARIVVSQQLSSASAGAIWRKVEAAFPNLTPRAIARAPDEKLRACGLSGAKIKTLRAVAAAALAGLDLDGLAQRPAEEAHAALTAIHGIGPWTADIYLLFCLGHSDIMPSGDLALRIAVGTGLGLPAPPSIKELHAIAGQWSPWRGVAACLFWAYYHQTRLAARARA